MNGPPTASQEDHDDWLYDAKDVPTSVQLLASAPEWLRRRDPHIVRALSPGQGSETMRTAVPARSKD